MKNLPTTLISAQNRVLVTSNAVDALRELLERRKIAIKAYEKAYRALVKENEELKKLKEENRRYKENYGEYVPPYLVLKQMLNSGQIAVGAIAVPPKNFTHPSLLYKHKAKRDAINYWLTLFEELEIIDGSSSRHYIVEMPYRQAKAILQKKIKEIKMKNEDIGYMPDNITCNLTKDEEEEITNEFTKKWN